MFGAVAKARAPDTTRDESSTSHNIVSEADLHEASKQIQSLLEAPTETSVVLTEEEFLTRQVIETHGSRRVPPSVLFKWLKIWSHPPESNRRPADYESAALPTELGWLT